MRFLNREAAETKRTQRRKKDICFYLLSLCSLCLCGFCVNPARAANLLANPSLEEIGENNLPAHWAPFAVSIPGKFSVDEAIKHDGKQSIRIDAPENTR